MLLIDVCVLDCCVLFGCDSLELRKSERGASPAEIGARRAQAFKIWGLPPSIKKYQVEITGPEIHHLKPHCIRCCHFKVDDVSALEAISKPPSTHC
jgi:hypothetical protein